MAKPFFRKPYIPQKKKAEHPLNGDGIESRVVSSREAQSIADEMGLDLVEIASNVIPPVCKICDYSKFLYALKKKKKDQEKNQSKSETKELRFTPTTDDHDISFKVKNAIGWLEEGDRVKCVVTFHGRSIQFKEKGEMLLLKVSQLLTEHGRVENLPTLEGKKMMMMVVPKKKK